MSVIRSIKKSILRLEIVAGLAFARALITLVPFKWWRRTLGPIDGTGDTSAQALTPRQIKMADDIGRMIARLAGKQKFEAVCFPQAITGRWVLGRRGIPSQIVLGSRQDPDKRIALHAWLKVGDAIVTGQSEYAQFREFERRAG